MLRLVLLAAASTLVTGDNCLSWCLNDLEKWCTASKANCGGCACPFPPPPSPTPASPPMTPLGSCFPNNMVEGLIPPPGTGWRGSTLETLGAIEAEYNVKFDSKLQLYRIFAGAGWAQ